MLDSLTRDLTTFDSFDLLGKVGALNLDPRNASRQISLETLAHLVAAQPHRPHAPTISLHRLRLLIQKHLGQDSEPGREDDPASNMFTEEIVWNCGPYLVFPGTWAGGHDCLMWLLRSVISIGSQVEAQRLRDEAVRAAMLCLSVSKEIARKAGISRGITPQLERELTIPLGNAVKTGSNAVTFSKADLLFLYDDDTSFDETICPLTVNSGDVDWEGYRFGSGNLHQTPFVRFGDQYVIPIPSSLLLGLMQRILHLALEQGVLSDLGWAFRKTVWAEIEMLLGMSASAPRYDLLPNASPTTFFEGAFTLDSDKVLYVQLATDDWEGSTGQTGPAQWDVSRLLEELDQRNSEVIEHLETLGLASHRILTLTLMQSTGRWFISGFADPPYQSVRTFMPATSFKPMAILDSADPLWLWKFAKASNNLRNRKRVFVFDPLDEYSTYRAQGCSYLTSRYPTTDEVLFVPGEGLSIREQLREKLDPHGVPAFIEGHLIEVWSMSDMDLPIYWTPMLVGLQRPAVVEGGMPIPVWVIGQEYIDFRLAGIQQEIIDLVAFWIWQFESLIFHPLQQLVGIQDAFTIELLLVDQPSWVEVFETSRLKDSDEGSSILEAELTRTGMRISIDSRFLSRIDGPTNEGERDFVRDLLIRLSEILRTYYSISPTEMTVPSIDESLETLAPVGNKKKLVITSSDPIFYHDFQDLPPLRSVQEADRSETLESVEERVTIALPEINELRSANVRKESMNKAVEFLYKELVQQVSSFGAMDLLNNLLAHNESNVQRRSQWDLTVPTRLACFGQRVDLVRHLVEETQSIDVASVANRFLIEYVTSNPPNGSEIVSLAAYDKLLALSNAIIYFGTIGDYAYFGLGDVDDTSPTSGRLSVAGQINEVVWSKFRTNLTRDDVALLERNFHDHWFRLPNEPQVDTRARHLEEELDNAFSGEFGITLTELGAFLRHMLEIGLMQEGLIKQMPRLQIIKSLYLALGWDEEKVTLVLCRLALGPRDDFLTPPGGSATDVYPWRHNRSWSFLWRPLVATGYGPDSLIMWGNRHIMRSLQYISNACITGHIKAKTQVLKQVVGRVRDSEARQFEDYVGLIVSGLTGMQAHVRAKKIGKRRIMADGDDLGDIDVLGVIPSKRVVLCIECKALALARTPAEVRNQLRELFIGSKDRASTISKHMKRAIWVEENLEEVLEFLKIEHRRRKWTVKPMLVSDSEIFASYLTHSPMPVWSIETLRGMTIEDIAG